jgi:hypothetical protein
MKNIKNIGKVLLTNTIIPFNVDDEEEILPLIKKEDEEYYE